MNTYSQYYCVISTKTNKEPITTAKVPIARILNEYATRTLTNRIYGRHNDRVDDSLTCYEYSKFYRRQFNELLVLENVIPQHLKHKVTILHYNDNADLEIVAVSVEYTR
ncbi:hypothetical protein HT594_00081 [Phenacoccus solenopsis nudivirus]|nr:hypothetical protein HT594_00081 [Phenacoccus solenopsis nudivirus]